MIASAPTLDTDAALDATGLSVATIMPHRYRMMLLDRVLQYDPDTPELVGMKCIGMNDPLLDGHFPDRPVFPGALLTEALAQSCGALMNLEHLRRNGLDMDTLFAPGPLDESPELPMTVLVDSKIKHNEVGLPGDRVFIEVTQAFSHGDVRTFQVRASSDDLELASGTIMLAYGHDLEI